MTFLQELLDFSTVKVHLATILVCQRLWRQNSGSTKPRLLVYERVMAPVSRPVSRNLAAIWDLSMVLNALSGPPFWPLLQAELRVLSLKTALLFLLASAKCE